jgi:hypothetical protein
MRCSLFERSCLCFSQCFCCLHVAQTSSSIKERPCFCCTTPLSSRAASRAGAALQGARVPELAADRRGVADPHLQPAAPPRRGAGHPQAHDQGRARRGADDRRQLVREAAHVRHRARPVPQAAAGARPAACVLGRACLSLATSVASSAGLLRPARCVPACQACWLCEVPLTLLKWCAPVCVHRF